MRAARTTRKPAIALAAIALTAWLAVPAEGGPAAATVKATGSRTWNPKTKSVAAGTKVVWKNSTGISHTVTSYRGGWNKNSSLPNGDKTSFRFNNSGTYKYRCTIHSTLDGGKCEGMCGKVKVS